MGEASAARAVASGRAQAPASSASLALVLKRAEQLVRVAVQPVLAESGLGLEHWRILAALEAQPGLPMSLLGEAAVVPAASLTRHVDKLVEVNLVVRRIDPDDRRRTVTGLSARGVAYVTRLRVVEASAQGAVRDELDGTR